MTTHQGPPKITVEDLRAELARAKIPLYVIAPRVGLHPNTIGRMLSGRRGLRPGLAERILRAIAELRP